MVPLAMLNVDSISAGTGSYNHGSKKPIHSIEDIHIRSIYALFQSGFFHIVEDVDIYSMLSREY
jgi:hypothetical protein